ncbi:hypothetical protein [Aporhodopirellula aestuarii]|uniref:Uncharacterized protein n=1 Tax=Aporhodopirellula aestuarii TaxID=2950107 RepID=A0ABT0UAQ4_9BACT|nr:hypothetical protein [Aporhodopirellula aestuarii]MCM2373406.1 hypothetical protein [Aporhodopirellula aestuarii]
MTDHRTDSPETTVDPDAEHFAQTTSGIYRRVDSESVWSAIRYAVRHQLPAKNPTIMMMFVRIAEVYPEVRDFLMQQLPEANDMERSALGLILDPPEGIRNAEYLPQEIASPGEMDLCWSEFLVTGSTQPIEKVVAVLDRDDLARPLIDSLLSGDDGPPMEFDDNELMELASVGIALGRTDGPWKVMSPGDVDILLWFGLKDQNQACTRVFQEMNDEQRVHVANKGAAMWSLRANAAQHGTIRLFCEEQSKREGGQGRLLIDPST